MEQKIIDLIASHSKIVIYHHERIDGDSLACSYGLLQALKLKYPDKIIKWIADVNYIQNHLKAIDVSFVDTIDSSIINDEWLAIIGDTSSLGRIYGNESYQKTKNRICFDHHQNSVDHPVDLFWHEPDLPASSIQAYLIIKALKISIPKSVALVLWYGIMTDTGFFQFSLAKQAPLQACLELQKVLDDKSLSELYERMHQKSINELHFQGYVLQNFVKQDSLAYFVVTSEIQSKFSLSSDQCARVNYLSGIQNVKAWLFFIDYGDFIRVEFRSHGAKVNKVATQFGGGGHIRAAGCSLKSFDQIKLVIKAMQLLLKNDNN